MPKTYGPPEGTDIPEDEDYSNEPDLDVSEIEADPPPADPADLARFDVDTGWKS